MHNSGNNPIRRHEAVARDTAFSDTPAVDSGVKQAQFLWAGTPWLLLLTL